MRKLLFAIPLFLFSCMVQHPQSIQEAVETLKEYNRTASIPCETTVKVFYRNCYGKPLLPFDWNDYKGTIKDSCLMITYRIIGCEYNLEGKSYELVKITTVKTQVVTSIEMTLKDRETGNVYTLLTHVDTIISCVLEPCK